MIITASLSNLMAWTGATTDPKTGAILVPAAKEFGDTLSPMDHFLRGLGHCSEVVAHESSTDYSTGKPTGRVKVTLENGAKLPRVVGYF